jgi:hypothetical protein
VALDLELEDVSPFLPPLNTAQQARIEAWLPVLDILLDARYGANITEARRPLFVATAADALERRLSRPAGMIDSQSIGSASVKYNSRAPLTSWFLAEELALLDDACGLGGGIRSVRIPAPDGVRFGNSDAPWVELLAEAGLLVEED